MMHNEISQDRSLYVVLSKTSSGIGSAIRFVTNYEYNHASVATDKHLSFLYSFARKNRNAVLSAGFVEESLLRYYWKPEKDVVIKLFRVPLDENNYIKMRRILRHVSNNRERYIYNYLTMLSFFIGKRVSINRAFTCVEFVEYLLSELDIVPKPDKKAYASVKTLDSYLSDYLIYEGRLADVAVSHGWGDDKYYLSLGMQDFVRESLRSMKELFVRLLA